MGICNVPQLWKITLNAIYVWQVFVFHSGKVKLIAFLDMHLSLIFPTQITANHVLLMFKSTLDASMHGAQISKC